MEQRLAELWPYNFVLPLVCLLCLKVTKPTRRGLNGYLAESKADIIDSTEDLLVG